MAVRKTSRAVGSQNAIVLAILLAAPAAASQLGNEAVTAPQPQAAIGPAAAQVQPRARAAWLRECRRRMGYNNDSADSGRSKRKIETVPREIAYDYCEAYFDDYYRNYQQQAAGTAPRPQPSQTVSPVIAEQYVSVPRRAARQKPKAARRKSAQ